MLGVKRFDVRITSDALVRPDFKIKDRETGIEYPNGKFPGYFKGIFAPGEAEITANLDIMPYSGMGEAGYYMFVQLWYGEMFFAYVPSDAPRYQAHIFNKAMYNAAFFIIDKERHLRYEEGKFPPEFKNMSVEDIKKNLKIIVDGGYESNYGTYVFERLWTGDMLFNMELTEEGKYEESRMRRQKEQEVLACMD